MQIGRVQTRSRTSRRPTVVRMLAMCQCIGPCARLGWLTLPGQRTIQRGTTVADPLGCRTTRIQPKQWVAATKRWGAPSGHRSIRTGRWGTGPRWFGLSVGAAAVARDPGTVVHVEVQRRERGAGAASVFEGARAVGHSREERGHSRRFAHAHGRAHIDELLRLLDCG